MDVSQKYLRIASCIHTIKQGVKDELAVLLNQVIDVAKNATILRQRSSTLSIGGVTHHILEEFVYE